MIKKTIVTLVVIVAILGIVFAAYGNNNNKTSPNTTNSTSSGNVNVTVNNTTSNNNNSNSSSTISPAEAQKIAKTFIAVSTATAGTPKLVNQNGTLVYIVPVIDNNATVGEIDIDAKTGKNLGGAGGAP
jgi:uncharacterized membrane protein YkoI